MKNPLLIIILVTLGAFSLPQLAKWAKDDQGDLQKEIANLKNELADLKSVNDNSENLTSKVKNTKNQIVSYVTWEPDGSHKDDPFIGSGDTIMMAFIDYSSKTSLSFYKQTFPKLKKDFFSKNSKFLLRDFPLKSNKLSPKIAQAAHCAGEQGKYWEMADLLFEMKQPESLDKLILESSELEGINSKIFTSCMKSKRYRGEIERDIADGQSLGAVGSPGFFIGQAGDVGQYKGVFIRGAQPYSVLSAYLKRYLEQGKNVS